MKEVNCDKALKETEVNGDKKMIGGQKGLNEG
jgi:hypothetical protein